MDHEHHAGPGTHGGDHSPATGQLPPNEHRQHAEPDTHGGHGGDHGHGAHAGHGGHGDHAAMFRRRFWLSLAPDHPRRVYSEMVQDWLGLHPAAFPGSRGWRRCSAPSSSSTAGWPFLTGGWASCAAASRG